MNHALPRRPLHPLAINLEAKHAPYRPAVLLEAIRAAPHCERATAERPFRVANQRARLNACYWAAPCPSGFATRGLLRTPLIARHGSVKPMWLGGRP